MEVKSGCVGAVYGAVDGGRFWWLCMFRAVWMSVIYAVGAVDGVSSGILDMLWCGVG